MAECGRRGLRCRNTISTITDGLRHSIMDRGRKVVRYILACSLHCRGHLRQRLLKVFVKTLDVCSSELQILYFL